MGILLVILTVHSIYLPTNVVLYLRRRLKVIFSNTRNIRFIFEDNVRLKIFISLAIDLYNHYMNGVDVIN